MRIGRFEIDRQAREARIGGSDIRLKPREFQLLGELARNTGIARDCCKRFGASTTTATIAPSVNVHVHRLRLKIEGAPRRLPSLVHSRRGAILSTTERVPYYIDRSYNMRLRTSIKRARFLETSAAAIGAAAVSYSSA